MSPRRFSAGRASAVPSAQPPQIARDRAWDLLLLCLAGLILTSVGRLHLLFPVLAPLRPMLLLGILGVALFVLDTDATRRLRQLRTPSCVLLLGFLGWMAVSAPFALRQYNSFWFLFDNFLKTVLFYGLVVVGVRSLRDVERLAWVYFLSAALYSAVVLSRYQVGVDSWRLQTLYTYDPNDFAVLAVSAIPIGLVALTDARRGTHRVLALAGVATVGVAFVWAGSRGGFLALGCVVAYLLFRYRAIPARWRMLVSGLIAAVVLGTASVQFWNQMQTLLSPEEDYNLSSEYGRIQIWKRGWGYMTQHPLVGVGPSNFPVAEGVLSAYAERAQYGLGVKWSAAHNSYLQVGAELGFPGLFLFVGFLVATLRALRRAEENERSANGAAVRLAQGLRASLIGFLVGAVFLSLAYSEMLYALAALSAGVAKVSGGCATVYVRRAAARRTRSPIASLVRPAPPT